MTPGPLNMMAVYTDITLINENVNQYLLFWIKWIERFDEAEDRIHRGQFGLNSLAVDRVK